MRNSYKLQSKTTWLIILISFIQFGCNSTSDYDKIFKENQETFANNKLGLNAIVLEIEGKFLQSWDKQQNLNIDLNDLSPKSKTIAEDLGIDGISVNQNPFDSCREKHEIVFNISNNWNIDKLRFVQLVYSPCNKNAEKDFHSYDGYHIDIWGLGENWYIISDTDWM
ncbi:MAG: hypothetical protein EOO46_12410 [Flavobacterium sp.]|nr:MAG: hypothetical protein EOO46_12410 [Flavobacterium sp.]